MINCKVCGILFEGNNRKKCCSKECSKKNAQRIKREYYERNSDLVKKRAKENREQNLEKYKETKRKYYQKNKKRINAKVSKWKKQNRKRTLEMEANYRKKHREEIRERHRKFVNDNPEKVKIYAKKYRQTDKAKAIRCDIASRRRALLMNAQPEWVNKDDIKEVYIMAKDIQWLSEEKMEVDHIIPLNSDKVCGLHVPWNLQIITKTKNIKKSNKLLKEYL